MILIFIIMQLGIVYICNFMIHIIHMKYAHTSLMYYCILENFHIAVFSQILQILLSHEIKFRESVYLLCGSFTKIFFMK